MSIEELTAELYDTMKKIMSEAKLMGETSEHEVLKIMFLQFAATGKKKNLSLMPHVVAAFIQKEYPHLKEEFDKLLLLV